MSSAAAYLVARETTVASEDFKLRTSLVGQLVLRARSHFDIWWVYQGANTRPLYLDTMNRYRHFFRFDEHANFVAAVTYLCQIGEVRPDTLNLSSLITQGRAEGIPIQSIEQAAKTLASVQVLWKRVVILRSNLFVHRSATLSYGQAFKKASVTPNHLRELAECELAVVNCLTEASGGTSLHFFSETTQDTIRMLEAVRSVG